MTEEQEKVFSKMKIYTFIENNGVKIIKGKALYPVMIRMHFSISSLWQIAKQILFRLENQNHSDEEYLFFGKLTNTTEEEK